MARPTPRYDAGAKSHSRLRDEHPRGIHGSVGMSTGWNWQTLVDDLGARGEAPALLAVRRGAVRTLSCKTLATRARDLANGLLLIGVSPGEPVALIGPNGFDWVVARLALGLAGAAAVPIDELATETEVRQIFVQTKARRAFCDAPHAEILRRIDTQLSLFLFGESPTPEGARTIDSLLDSRAQILPAARPDGVAMLAYTSGTTGAPKAIVLTLENIATNVRALVQTRLVGADDRVLLPLPLHHVYPFIVGLLGGLASGSAIVFPQSTTGPDILEGIGLGSVSVMVGVPRLYSAICSGLIDRIAKAGLVRRVLLRFMLGLSASIRRKIGPNIGRFLFFALRRRFGEHLRLLVSGGARLEPETLDLLMGMGFEVRSGYGLAETASIFTANLPGRARWGSEGRPIAGEMRISNPDQSKIGEIELKGPQIFPRYLDNSEATVTAFTTDGWFRTGDLGFVDRNGFLFVTGRAKEKLVLGGGKKVDPEELERIYGASSYIREIAVFELHGKLVALVVPSLEAVRSGGSMHIDTAIRVQLASSARALPSYQRLAGFAIAREPLPRTRLGKYRRFLIPQIYENAKRPMTREAPALLSAEDDALLKQPIARDMFNLLHERYPNKSLSLDTSPLLDLGIDSLEWISFGLELENKFGLRLTEADIGGIVTIRDLLAAAGGAHVAAPPLPAASRDWTARTGLVLILLGLVILALDQIVMRGAFHLRVQGREHLPTNGNFILVANHSSYLDAPALAAALPYDLLRRCYWAGDPVLLFDKRWKWPLMRAMRCYPLNEREPAHSLAVSEAILSRGDNIVWFPEGWRSPDGKLQSFLPGIGNLLERAPVTVVPALIQGTFEALPRDHGFSKLHLIRVRFGNAIIPADWKTISLPETGAAQRIADFLHTRIEQLVSEAGG